MSPAAHLFRKWRVIERRIRHARRAALFTDFDGTLARIRTDPDQVRLPSRVRKVLKEIASSGTIVGVVSGRKVSDVRARVGLRGIWYAGAHGFFLRDPNNRSYSLLSPRQRRRMRTLRRILTRRLRGLRGLRLEPKQAAIAVHYRGAPAASRSSARRVIAELLEQNPEISLLAGKKVWGLLPDSATDKWAAINFILRRERRHHPGRQVVVFLGDDATDERVFQKMSGISIAVGKKHATAARYYLRSPAEVRQFLEKWRASVS